MNAKPQRRWFQFRLSTWFVLIAIVAWAMALRPWGEYVVRAMPTRPGRTDVFSAHISRNVPQERLGLSSAGSDSNWVTDFRVYTGNPRQMRRFLAVFGPAEIVWPVLSLAVLAAWKLAWRMVDRRRERAAPLASSDGTP